LPCGTVQQRRFLRASDGAILKAVNKWLERLPPWKLAVLSASAIILTVTITFSYGYVSDRHYGVGIRWWVTRGVILAVILTGGSTLTALTRHGKRGSGGRGDE
jgi:hypothetical protein